MSTVRAIHQSLLPVDTNRLEKEALTAYFLDSWNLNELLFDAIHHDEAFYLSPDPLRNPLIFYYGHTAVFYINKLVLAGLLNEGINAHFEHILAKGVDPDLPQNLDVRDVWPAVSEIHEYREKVKTAVLAVIETMENNTSVDSTSPYWALLMCIEHDRIHFETSSVLIRQLDARHLKRPDEWEYAPMNVSNPEEHWIQSTGGVVRLGKQVSDRWFGWDNEYGTKMHTVAPFEATQNLITNEEYLAFFSGGYADKRYWSLDGWNWKERTNTKHPKFWVRTENGFHYRALFDIIEMPMDWPVEVNAFEAEAYCNWKGAGTRLLTEAEFNFASNLNRREEPVHEESINVNFRYGSPTPVGYCEDSKSKFNDLYGNVWDWLATEHAPLDGYKAHPFYEDFSAPYMDSDHLMMAGGSWITTGTGASKHYRLWFRPYFYQHAGFRLARNLITEPIPQHTRIIAEALSRNFNVEESSPTDAILTKGSATVRLRQGVVWNWINGEAILMCDNKSAAKSMFNELNIPCPLSYAFEKVEDLHGVQWDRKYVLKPVSGSNGDGVKLNIVSIEQVHDYLSKNRARGPLFLLEELVEGYDLRIQVLGKKIVAACERIPAEVVGDGHSTVEELAAQRNEVVKQQNPSNYLAIDDESLRLIAEQGLTLNSVLPTGKTLRLKEIANMGRGARAVDCTDDIDPSVSTWIEAICQKLNISYFALDIICTDRSDISSYKALEINTQAEWFHHTFSEGRQHDLEVQVVDEIERGCISSD